MAQFSLSLQDIDGQSAVSSSWHESGPTKSASDIDCVMLSGKVRFWKPLDVKPYFE